MFFKRKNNVDLRLFATVQMSDSWDGRTTCANGCTWLLLLYKDRVVDTRATVRVGSSVELRSKYGNAFWWHMYTVSKIYMRILRIARYKYFDGAGVGQEEIFDTSNPDWDVVYAESDIWATLIDHPQYLEVVKNFELDLVPLKHGFRVMVHASTKSRTA